MPEALIVADDGKSPDILRSMAYKGIVKCVSVNGVNVYGRHYLSASAIRLAYKRKLNKKRKRGI
jgi:hypothetical protein